MSYKTIRDYFVARLTKQGFQESGEMEFVSDGNLKNRFIFRQRELVEERPTLVDRFQPNRIIEIRLGTPVSDSKVQQAEYTNLQIRIDVFLREVLNPTNFQASSFSIRNISFQNMTEEIQGVWIQFTLTFRVEDELLYA